MIDFSLGIVYAVLTVTDENTYHRLPTTDFYSVSKFEIAIRIGLMGSLIATTLFLQYGFTSESNPEKCLLFPCNDERNNHNGLLFKITASSWYN